METDRSQIDLLLLVARRSPTAEQLDEIAHRVADVDNWGPLLNRALAHGLGPLLYRNVAAALARAGTPAQTGALSTYYSRNAARALRLTASMLRVLGIFAEHGIRAVPYKGPPLAVLAYGDVGLRQAGDLDVLISRDDFPRAREVLLASGYTYKHDITPAMQAFQLASRYSMTLIGPDDVHLDLHWAFANRDIPFSLRLESVIDRVDSVLVSGRKVPIFSRADLLMILSVHGAKHRWDRIEWIAGVAEVVRQSHDLDWNDLLQRASRLKVLRTLLLGLAVANRLLQAPLPQHVLDRIDREPWVRRLEQDVVGRLYARGDGSRRGLMGLLSHNLFQLPLQERLRDQVGFVLYRLTTPHKPAEWRAISYKERVFNLHRVTWPFRLIGKALRRITGRR